MPPRAVLMAGRVWVNSGEIAGNGIDDDGNGSSGRCGNWLWKCLRPPSATCLFKISM